MFTPSLKLTPADVPGHCAVVWAGTWLRLLGKVTGSLPEGFAVPKISAAIALPTSWPGYQLANTPATEFSHGMTTGPPLLSTTMVFGFAAATCWISDSSVLDRLRLARSDSSPSGRLTKMTASVAALAAVTACPMLA